MDGDNSLLEKAKQYVEDCDYEKGEEILKKLFKKDPNNIQVLDLLGEIYLNSNNYKGAKKMLEKSITLNPNENGDKYIDYAQLLDSPIERVKSYQKAIELFTVQINSTINNDESKNFFKEKIASAYASIVSLYMTTKLCELPDAENICEDSLKKALNIYPESFDALLQLSNLRIIRKKDNEAKSIISKLLEYVKKCEEDDNLSLPEKDMLINLAKNFAELNYYKEAIYIIKFIIKRNDEDLESIYYLAFFQNNYENYESSMETLERFNNLYIKMQNNKPVYGDILKDDVIQDVISAAKELHNSLTKIQKNNPKNYKDNHPDDEDGEEEEVADDVEDNEDVEMK